MEKSKTVAVEGQLTAASSSQQRVSVKDRLGPSKSVHERLGSQGVPERSHARDHGDTKRKLFATTSKKPVKDRKRIEGTPPRIQYREGPMDKASTLAKMAQETDMALKALLQQREEIAKQMVFVTEMEGGASSYTQPEEQGRFLGKRARGDEDSRISKNRLRSCSPARSGERRCIPEDPRRASRHEDSRGDGNDRRRSRSRGRSPEASKK